ncbi:MAG: hypothetical protein J0M17_08325 [Planctomycetes bacterium]|nr:hypothetical protein [Planctomycetota bacterium]
MDGTIAPILRRQLTVSGGVLVVLFGISAAMLVGLGLSAAGRNQMLAALIGGGTFVGFAGWWLGAVRRSREDELRTAVELAVLVPQFRLEIRTCDSIPCMRDVARRLQDRFAEIYRKNPPAAEAR